MTGDQGMDELRYELLFTMRLPAGVARRQTIGQLPWGERYLVPIDGDSLEGRRLSGEVLRDGIEWTMVQPDGTKQFDNYLLWTFRAKDVPIAASHLAGPGEQVTCPACAAALHGSAE